jgi:hypothetical protein
VVEAVLEHALSGRAGAAGGGFSRLARVITRDGGGEVRVRSGAGLVVLGPGADCPPRGARLSAGHGTQIRVTLPIDLATTCS